MEAAPAAPRRVAAFFSAARSTAHDHEHAGRAAGPRGRDRDAARHLGAARGERGERELEEARAAVGRERVADVLHVDRRAERAEPPVEFEERVGEELGRQRGDALAAARGRRLQEAVVLVLVPRLDVVEPALREREALARVEPRGQRGRAARRRAAGSR